MTTAPIAQVATGIGMRIPSSSAEEPDGLLNIEGRGTIRRRACGAWTRISISEIHSAMSEGRELAA